MSELDPYELDPLFEDTVLYLAAASPSFWRSIGQHLDPDLMAHAQAKLLLGTIRAHLRRGGKHPSSTLVALQIAKLEVAKGKVAQSEVNALWDTFERVDDAWGAAGPNETTVTDVMVGVIRQRMHQRAVLLSHDEYSKRGDFSTVRGLLDDAQRLGQTEEIAPLEALDVSGFKEAFDRPMVEWLPTGIPQLDLMLGQGTPRGQLTVAMARSGGGKSMWLDQQAAQGILAGRTTLVVTLELTPLIHRARIVSHITGIPIDEITPGGRLEEAYKRYSHLAPHLGTLYLKEMPPGVSTVDDIRRLIDQVNEEERKRGTNKPVEVVVVDYADKLRGSMMAEKQGKYTAQGEVYEALRRDIAVGVGTWVHTACQARRSDARNSKTSRLLGLEDGADSINKARVSDIWLTLNPDPEDPTMSTIFVAKHRTGIGDRAYGPFPTHFECSRIEALAVEYADWSTI